MSSDFALHCVESSVPRNVQLRATDSSTVLLTWEPPAKSYGRISSYIIEWSRNNKWQESIRLYSSHEYRFKNLQPGESISASVCACNRPNTSVQFVYVGALSNVTTVTTPLSS